MRIWVLAGTPVTPTTARLVELAGEMGHDASVVDHAAVSLRHAADGSTLVGGPGGRPHLLVNRMRGDETHLRHATRLQTALESRGVPTANGASAVRLAAVKSATAERLAARGLPLPLTLVATVDTDPAMIVAETGLPVVVKADRAKGGLGTHRLHDEAALAATLGAMRADGVREVVCQPWLADAREMVRAVVLGGEVIGTIVRRPTAEEWRATAALGARVEGARLAPHEEALALAVAEACGLDVAGVDLLRRGQGDETAALALDVEPSPELRLTEAAEREDLTRRILEGLVAAARGGRLTRR